MTIRANEHAPYTSPAAIVTVIDRYRERGLQTPFDVDVLVKAGASESLAPRTLQALKLLGLIDGKGEPTKQFAALRRAPQAEFHERFASLLRGAYAEVFSFIDPSQDSRERVRDAFRSYKPFGQQERMVALFLGLCEYAGLARSEKPKPSRSPHAVASQRDSSGSRNQFDAAAGPMQAGTHPLIQGLLRELPSIGGTWPAENRKAWLELQAGVFKLLFRIGDTAPL